MVRTRYDSKIAAFKKEFPFTKEPTRDLDVRKVTVQRLDEGLLNVRRERVVANLLLPFWAHGWWQRILLLGEKGLLIREVDKRASIFETLLDMWIETNCSEETDTTDLIRYVVVLVPVDVEKFTPEWELTLYKMPNNGTIRAWLDERLAEAEKELEFIVDTRF
jgi:hypothetical protein